MRYENRKARQQEIRTAAYALLAEKGYRGTSMLAIAKKAKASNETLYKWYGTKQNLFRTLIEENAQEVREELLASLENRRNLDDALVEVGFLLLDLVLSEKAIALNRAAAADAIETGVLGRALAEAGRGTIAPLLNELILQAKDEGVIRCQDTLQATETFLGLLIGDLQIRRVNGSLAPLSVYETQEKAELACRQFFQLYH